MFFFFFRNNNFQGNWGIIYCYLILINSKILNSIFNHCYCSGLGGGIYLVASENSNVELFKICSNDCISGFGNYYQFGILQLFNSIQSLNSCNYLSITNITNLGFSSFCQLQGNISLTNYNERIHLKDLDDNKWGGRFNSDQIDERIYGHENIILVRV